MFDRSPKSPSKRLRAPVSYVGICGARIKGHMICHDANARQQAYSKGSSVGIWLRVGGLP